MGVQAITSVAQVSTQTMSRCTMCLLLSVLAVTALAKPWVPGGSEEEVEIEVGALIDIEAPVKAHPDNPRLFYLHGVIMDCGEGFLWAGANCDIDPDFVPPEEEG